MIRLSRLSAENARKGNGDKNIELAQGLLQPKVAGFAADGDSRNKNKRATANPKPFQKKRNGNAFGMYAHGSVSIVTHFFARTLV